MSRAGRHRDDEDFTVATDPRDRLDATLRGLPKLGQLQQHDDVPEHIDDEESAVIEIAIDGLISVAASPNAISIHRVRTRPLDREALKAREAKLTAERHIARADGRTPMSDRYPGQGTARKLP